VGDAVRLNRANRLLFLAAIAERDVRWLVPLVTDWPEEWSMSAFG